MVSIGSKRGRLAMAEYERSTTVQATPSATYGYLSDPQHLPDYVATMTQARATGQDHLRVAAEVQGRHEEGEAMFRADPSSRRLEWGREGHDYHGWLTVTDGGSDDTAKVTIHLHTHDDSDGAEVERALDETMSKIENAVSTV
jgi:Polyketide cyclase / dehydrase and lipid transport